MNNPSDNSSPGTDNAVTSVVWQWREKDEPPGAVRSRRLKKAFLQSGIMAAASLVLSSVVKSPAAAVVIASLAAVVLISGLAVPPVFRAWEAAGEFLGLAIGTLITWALLLPFFYICFTTGRIALLIRRHDPMARPLEKENTTYWSDHRKRKSLESYRKQY
ncbi:MAG: hypothetical protein R6V03_03010 [Kiritimatiellia bacterium]